MLKVAGDQKIVFGSALYKKGLKQFEANMDELLNEYHKHKIPVFLSDLVCNLKDQKPFTSNLSGKDTLLFMTEYRKGVADYRTGHKESALKEFLAANKMDSTYALNNYLIGEILFEKGDTEIARPYYNAAKELDVIRFRAPEELIPLSGNCTVNTTTHSWYTRSNCLKANLRVKWRAIHFLPITFIPTLMDFFLSRRHFTMLWRTPELWVSRTTGYPLTAYEENYPLQLSIPFMAGLLCCS